MRKNILIALAILILISTITAVGIYWKTQDDLHEVVRSLKKSVVKDFHDPESARFRSVNLLSEKGSIINRLKMVDVAFLWRSTPSEVFSVFQYRTQDLHLCGEVNAKNGFGAYVGYKHFWIRGGKNPIPFINTRAVDDFPENMCEFSMEDVIYSERDPE